MSADLDGIRQRVIDLRLMTDSRLSNAKRLVIAELLQYAQERDEQLAVLREHTLDSTPNLRKLHDLAVAYLDAVAALQQTRGGAPLSSTIGWLIRQRQLIPATGPGSDSLAPLRRIRESRRSKPAKPVPLPDQLKDGER